MLYLAQKCEINQHFIMKSLYQLRGEIINTARTSWHEQEKHLYHWFSNNSTSQSSLLERGNNLMLSRSFFHCTQFPLMIASCNTIVQCHNQETDSHSQTQNMSTPQRFMLPFFSHIHFVLSCLLNLKQPFISPSFL